MLCDSTGASLEKCPNAHVCISTTLKVVAFQEWLGGRSGCELDLKLEVLRRGLMVVRKRISIVTVMCSGGTSIRCVHIDMVLEHCQLPAPKATQAMTRLSLAMTN